MKKINFFAMALAALAMVSCSKEEAGLDTVQRGKAQVTVKITGQEDPAKSRAEGEPGAGDTQVNDYIIFLFNDGGGLIGTPKYVSGATVGTVDDATTAAKNIYIVANTGAIAGGSFVGVASLADLKTRVGDLIKSDASTQTKTNLWMVGTGTVGKFTPGAGKDDPSTATGTVVMTFLSARIDVVIKDERVHTTPADGVISIKDDKVALLFAGAKGKFFDTAAEQVTQTSFFSGITGYVDQTGGTTQADVLATPVTNKFTENAAGTVEYHFYTFGNDGTTMPTILTIQSTRTDADKATKTIYYPIRFSTTDAGQTIAPGEKYLVTLTLTGDVNNGGGGGTTDPEEELKAADITVTVTPAKWKTAIPVDKTFN